MYLSLVSWIIHVQYLVKENMVCAADFKMPR